MAYGSLSSETALPELVGADRPIVRSRQQRERSSRRRNELEMATVDVGRNLKPCI